jgi:hypothetical protein
VPPWSSWKRPELALAEAVRVATQGALLIALSRWSQGGFSRRWGADARRARLGQARDCSLPRLRALAASVAGPRLRAIRWASALFPGRPDQTVLRIPLGEVIGVAIHLAR